MAEAAVAVPGSIPDRPVAAGAPALPRLPLGTKLAYGFGLIAYGVKDNGFAYFLLLFYSQVIGVDARLVGLPFGRGHSHEQLRNAASPSAAYALP